MKYLKEQASTFVYGNLNIKAKSSGFKFDTFDLIMKDKYFQKNTVRNG
jgi:hypothetical protein